MKSFFSFLHKEGFGNYLHALIVLLWIFSSFAFSYGIGESLGSLIKNSTFSELIFAWVIHFLFVSIVALAIFFKIYSSWQLSEKYGRLTVVLIIFAWVIFSFEIFDFYWVLFRENSRIASGFFSGITFTPIFLICWEVAQRAFIYVVGVSWLNPAESLTLQEMIRNEIQRQIESANSNSYKNDEFENSERESRQYRSTRIYNQSGKVVTTKFTHYQNSGYWVTATTDMLNGKVIYAEHTRTDINHSLLGFEKCIEQEHDFNASTIWGAEYKSPTSKFGKSNRQSIWIREKVTKAGIVYPDSK